MNPFKVLMWICETFHIETLDQLLIAVYALDLAMHFISSALPGWAAFSSMQYVLSHLFSMVGSPPGRTTLAGRLIYLCSLGSLFFASFFVHCWLDYGWSTFWLRLGEM